MPYAIILGNILSLGQKKILYETKTPLEMQIDVYSVMLDIQIEKLNVVN